MIDKKVIAYLLFGVAFMTLIIVLAGCATMYPVPKTPICTVQPYAGCSLCLAFDKAGVSAEQMDNMLLDAALAGIGFKVLNGLETRESIEKLKMYVATAPNLLLHEIVDKIKIDPILMIIISRRMSLLETMPNFSTLALDAPSRGLIIAHLDHQIEQLSWF